MKAAASGLEKVPFHLRNPLNTTSKGTGELILQSYKDGFRKIYLGVGGSATSDGGLGALQGLGAKILVKDLKTNEIIEPPCFFGFHLPNIHSIEIPPNFLPNISIEISCDVNNPFVGPSGSVYVCQNYISNFIKSLHLHF